MVGDGEVDNITAISIRYNGVERFINTDTTNIDVGGRQFIVDFDPATGNPFPSGPNGNNTVNVTGLIDGVQIATYTGDGYTTLEFSWVSGQPFSIGGFGGSVIEAGVPVDFDVPIQLVDADGDTADSSIAVTLEPGGQPLASVDIAANLLTQTNPSSVVTIQFSEAPVNFTDADISAVGGTVTGLAATADPLVYTATFTATAGFSGIGSVTVGTAWQDADGNPGVGSDDAVAIDRSNPTVVDVVANDLVITDSDAVADTFSIAVTFSQAMNASATPTLIFAPSVASTLALTGGAWSAANTVYTASYTVADANVVVNGVTVDVTGAQDLAGNAQQDYTAVAEFSIDTVAPVASIILDAITADNVVNAAEAGGTVAITGTVGGDVEGSDIITLTVNGVAYTGTSTGGVFSIDVAGSDLAADIDTSVHASVTATDAAGNATTATDDQAYTVDTVAPVASIILDAITGDNIVNAAEAVDTTVAVTGTVGGDVADSDIITLTVNGVAYTGTSTGGVFSIDVAGSGLLADPDLTVDASVTATDASGNATTATADQAYTVAAVIIGDTTGAVVEAGGVANGTPGTPTDTGDLNSIDVDDPNDAWEVVSFPTASTYGTFTIDAAGVWTYTLDDNNTAVQALNVGQTLTDTFTATTVDGTEQLVTITINGRNDAAVISGAAIGSVVEAGGVATPTGTPTATGDLNSTDVDNNPNDAWTAVGYTGRQRLRQLHAHRRRGVDLHAGRQQCGRAGAQCGRDADRHLHGGDNGRHPAAGDHHHQRQERRRSDHRRRQRRGDRGRRRQ